MAINNHLNNIRTNKMKALKITEEQFISLALTADKDESVETSSLVFLKSKEGLLIQNSDGEYFLVRE